MEDLIAILAISLIAAIVLVFAQGRLLANDRRQLSAADQRLICAQNRNDRLVAQLKATQEQLAIATEKALTLEDDMKQFVTVVEPGQDHKAATNYWNPIDGWREGVQN